MIMPCPSNKTQTGLTLEQRLLALKAMLAEENLEMKVYSTPYDKKYIIKTVVGGNGDDEEREYVVVDDGESFAEAKEMLEEFMYLYVDGEFIEDVTGVDGSAKAIGSNPSEKKNDLIMSIIEGSVGFDKVAKIVIENEGYAPFIASYDQKQKVIPIIDNYVTKEINIFRIA